MLRIENLEANYKNAGLTLKGISLKVPDNGCVALLGNNGAGKTTTLRCITGVRQSVELKILQGFVEFNGEKINEYKPSDIIQRGIAFVPEGRMIFEDLTVEENLKVGAYSTKETNLSFSLEKVYHFFPFLHSRKRTLGGYLSGGEQQMLAIGRALMMKPKLLILDEPSLGLAPLMVEKIFLILRDIHQQEGTSILLVEQNAWMALEFCNYGYIMENGKIVLDGPTKILKTNEDVQEFYLGITSSGKRKSYKDVKSYKKRKRWVG